MDEDIPKQACLNAVLIGISTQTFTPSEAALLADLSEIQMDRIDFFYIALAVWALPSAAVLTLAILWVGPWDAILSIWDGIGRAPASLGELCEAAFWFGPWIIIITLSIQAAISWAQKRLQREH